MSRIFRFAKDTKLRWIAAGGGALTGLLVLPILWATWSPKQIEPSGDRRQRLQAILDEGLEWAKNEGVQDTSSRLTRLVQYFDEAKAGTDAFAEEVLGWSSKWAAAQDALTGQSTHQAVIEELFAKHHFDPADLERFLGQAVEEFIQHENDVDAQLLVRLKADLAELQGEAVLTTFTPDALEAHLARASAEVSRAVMADLQGTLGRELASFVAGQLLSQAATQMAASAGILGTGATSGAMSFGAGLVVGVAVDWVVSWAYEELYHPRQEISGRMWSQLDQLARLIIYGNSGGERSQPGFIGWMFDYHDRRVQARAQAMQALLSQ